MLFQTAVCNGQAEHVSPGGGLPAPTVPAGDHPMCHCRQCGHTQDWPSPIATIAARARICYFVSGVSTVQPRIKVHFLWTA